VLWDNSGIRVWLFHRGSIPADLIRDAPLPETWGEPMATFGSSSCNPWQYMQNHVAIFDITLWCVLMHVSRLLCSLINQSSLSGTWAGSAGSWGSSCQASTGYGTCTQYVQNQGGALANACEFCIIQRAVGALITTTPCHFLRLGGRERQAVSIDNLDTRTLFIYISLCLAFHLSGLQLTLRRYRHHIWLSCIAACDSLH
jgi:hypothetical protein